MSDSIDHEHGHTDHTCGSCTAPNICDCPCETCISSRLGLDAPAPAAVAIAAPKSWIQRALDDEWAAANFDGPGCPFCDSRFPCGCTARRAEMIVAECRREQRERRQALSVTGCTCTEEDGHPCPYCDEREDGHDYEEEEQESDRYSDRYSDYDPYFDPSDPWGDGAPEEHSDYYE
jgi:hypothetical protein